MIGDPDPYTAAMNALQYFHISEVVDLDAPVQPLRVGGEGPDRALAARRRRPVQHVEAKDEVAA